MGQRLVVIINSNGKDLANSYYHWDAYSLASLETIKPIVDFLNADSLKNINESDAIKLLQISGAEVTDEELKYCEENNIEVKRQYEKIDRNRGLIAVSKEEMTNSLDWAEGIIEIYVDEKKINYKVCWDALEDDYTAELREEGKEITKINLELKDFPIVDFKDIPYLMSKIEEAQRTDGYLYNNENLYGIIY